ncbi:FKBP-type peptidyl-prolyl cis-trans isomerase [Leucobacter allii]|uniref:FKBP-type peptidyl-prolyl cis-trans isomerase n=1 Tax=Leucobacter allii TaxID=2932247 RepID=UPI001FD07D96|nr:FKBP-type peptidyl-prolyl cis-trans isomerase [Leucobacter allii]UOR00634.1 FKBP-type peptidyl-prolyl cis-trans isomerase [Leucobacter allii]
MKLTRALIPTVAVGALLLTGCSTGGAPTKDAAGAECLTGGAASDAVAVSGEVGTDLELTSEAPYAADEIQRTVLQAGEGAVPEDGQNVMVAMTMFNGADGSEIQQVPASSVPFTESSLNDWAYEGLRCAVAGEQIAIVAPYADVFGEATPEETGVEGITEDDSVVVVMETTEISDEEPTSGEPGTLQGDELLSKAEGTAQDAPEGLPSVKLAENGEPTITIPEGVEAPGELQVATLIAGDGETVAEGDRVYVNYRGVIWRTGEEFDSSWSRGEPTDFLTTQVIGGFSEALVGQKVGSQVISVVPAEDGGYGADQLQSMGYEADDVMVFVLDILGTVHADAAE